MDRSRQCATLFCSRTSLFVLMTGYAFLGALIFKALEGGDANDVPAHVKRSREDCLKELWLITERLNVLYEKNWTRLVTEQLKRFERSVVEAGKDTTNPTSSHWTFGGALLYSITLLTTVGYNRLSPKTAVGKIAAVIYAIIGVPLMLILLSVLGGMLATGVQRIYTKLCCKQEIIRSPTVGYHKAPTNPHYFQPYEDTASIQIPSSHSTPSHTCKEVPKQALLATVRASHARGRCRQSQNICPAHLQTPKKSCLKVGLEEDEDLDNCIHDTPSRVPLIWRPPEDGDTIQQPKPSVPTLLVLIFFTFYIFIGATGLFVSTKNWNFFDAIYFCFIALSTIGIGDNLPQTDDLHAQIQLLACCLYLFFGLIVVATCFSLLHEEITFKCRHNLTKH